MSTTTTMPSSSGSLLLTPPSILPRINAGRLDDALHESCQWGNMGPDGAGMNRLALNEDDAQVRRWLIKELQSLGCDVKVDQVGNIFGIFPGIDNALPPIGIGSHLDTQPIGGRYDGILGVLSGLEVLRALKEAGYRTTAPIAVVDWTNEEGARFVPSMLGSGVWAGRWGLQFGHSREDSSGVSLRTELEKHGFLGETPSSFVSIPLSAHFEVHIEQGPILCNGIDGAPVGLVKGVQGFKWFEIELKGRTQHAATPMGRRLDPLLPFARFVVESERLAYEHGGSVTIGRIGSKDVQSTNCVLPTVLFSLDVRHHQAESIRGLTGALRLALDRILSEGSYEPPSWRTILEENPVNFAERAVDAVKHALSGKPYKIHELISGAGHDSVHTSSVCDTAMIFVRCHEGLSHCAEEFSSPEDNAEGAKVLLEAVLEYDRRVFGSAL